MEAVEKHELNWSLACRICLKKSNHQMKCIFDELCFSDDIVTKIIKCGGTPVDIMDGMPDRICNQCLSDLDIAFRFRNACQQSYHQLIIAREVALKQCDDYSLDELKEEKQEPEAEKSYNDSPKPNHRRESFNTIYINEEVLIDDDDAGETLSIEVPLKQECDTENSHQDVPTCKTFKSDAANSRKGMKRIRKGRSVDPSTTYICYCCGNLYKSQSKLSQHIKLHSAEKPHECEICDKKFAQAAQLSRHMNSHTGNRPYKCNYCPSSFADPSTCIKHQRIHTNDRPFKCLECGKAFAYSNVLKVHQKTHTGEKPFSCSICDKKFTQLHHKKSHERTHSSYSGSEGRTKKKDNYSVDQ